MKTEFTNITPNLTTNDIDHTLKFYCDILGFTLIKKIPEQGYADWILLKKDKVMLMFQKVNLHNARTGCNSLYIQVKNIRPFHDSLEDKVEIVSELEHTFYDTIEFSILDNNGYLITFAEFVEK